MCRGGIVEDEPHVVFDCPFYDDLRMVMPVSIKQEE